jgi:hypothetical protein
MFEAEAVTIQDGKRAVDVVECYPTRQEAIDGISSYGWECLPEEQHSTTFIVRDERSHVVALAYFLPAPDGEWARLRWCLNDDSTQEYEREPTERAYTTRRIA